jgi:hypothetical protein
MQKSNFVDMLGMEMKSIPRNGLMHLASWMQDNLYHGYRFPLRTWIFCSHFSPCSTLATDVAGILIYNL